MNINSIRNKFDTLQDLVRERLDIIIVIETKLDETFPSQQFKLNGFKGPYRKDRNCFGGGIMAFVNENIPSYVLNKFISTDNFEGMFLELNLRKQKFLLFCGYRSDHEIYGLNKSDFLHELSLGLDRYSNYDNMLIAGDFNMEEKDGAMQDFLYQFNAKCLVKVHTCIKSNKNPTTVDHFITNTPRKYQNTHAICTGLSDFHKMIVTVLKTAIPKSKPREIRYRSYSKFSDEAFQQDIDRELNFVNINEYETFEKIFLTTLNRHAPLKTKHVRANDKPFITKTLRKAMMKTSTLEKKYWKCKTETNREAYRKQKNYTNKLRKKRKGIL